MSKVSYYKNIKDSTSKEQVPLIALLEGIRIGRWQDHVLTYRNSKKQEDKICLPNFTVSGLFKQRRANELINHSGYIAMDFDDMQPEARNLFIHDPYTFSCFTSVGGFGFCVIVKIKPDLHKESWEQLANHYRDTYGICVDPSGKDVSRTRFISYDPDCYINESAKTFTAKKIKAAPINKEIATTDDVTRLIASIVSKQVDITTNYSDWVGLGFYLYEKYGATTGLDLYHQLSQFHPNYNQKQVAKKWDSFKAGSSTGSQWGTGSLFYLAKQAGVEIDRSRTRDVSAVMKVAKKSGTNITSVSESLEIEGKAPLTADESKLWDQVNPDDKDSNDNDVLKAAAYIRMNKDVYIDAINKIPVVNGQQINDYILNSLVLECIEKDYKVTPAQIAGIINSNKFPTKDPLREYFMDIQCTGTDAIAQTIEALNAKEPELAAIFMKYWFVGVMNTLYDYPVPYCPIIIGDQKNGKTYWIRELTTPFLKKYYIEKHLSLSADDKLQMCECLIICNDEYGGAMVKDQSAFKQLLSAVKFSLRRAYGRYNEEYRRIASMIGTSNEEAVLFDYTGNRRIFPINTQGKINYKLHDSIDKTKLWGQVYNMWVNKLWPVEMTDDHMALLKGKFDEHYQEDKYDIILSNIIQPAQSDDDFLSNYDLSQLLQTHLKSDVIPEKIGHSMKKLGFEKVTKKVKGKTFRGYKVTVTQTVTMLSDSFTGF